MTDKLTPDRPEPNVPLTTAENLKVGDVVQIAVQLRDKTTGQDFWWKRFAAVVRHNNSKHFEALTLKMHVDMDKDLRIIDLRSDKQVVTWLPPEQWPQGVSAMHMKLVATGRLKLD